MNVLVIAVAVNLAVLVGSEEIDFNTILQLLKARRSNTNPEADSIETIPVVPGFLWQKPKELSAFKNPAPWPDFRYKNATREDTSYQTKVQEGKGITPKKDDHLTQKILKAVKNLNRYRESQKSLKTKQNEPTVTLDNNTPSTSKLMSQILKEVKANNRDLNKNYKYKQKQSIESAQIVDLGKLVKKYLNTNTNRNYYQGNKKNYRNDQSEEISTYSRADKDLLGNILKAIENNDQRRGDDEQDQQSVIFIESQPDLNFRSRLLAQNVAEVLYGRPKSSSFHNVKTERANHAKEDGESDYENNDAIYKFNGRRNDDDDDDDASEESEMEKNPGNPFTIHKNKYKQNWPYDHFMDGDHMNINPFGPQFQSLGPSGPELFFGRKWWYFNQDDYKPMG